MAVVNNSYFCTNHNGMYMWFGVDYCPDCRNAEKEKRKQSILRAMLKTNTYASVVGSELNRIYHLIKNNVFEKIKS